jgi:hypothetical protein
VAPSATPPLIDETAQGLEKLGGSMDLVEDDQAILIAAQEQRCVAQFGAVLTRFEVEIERLRLAGDLERERRFAHLTRPQQRHGCLPVERISNRLKGAARDHRPCKLNVSNSICTVPSDGHDHGSPDVAQPPQYLDSGS